MPAEMGSAYVFLVSADSTAMTGQLMHLVSCGNQSMGQADPCSTMVSGLAEDWVESSEDETPVRGICSISHCSAVASASGPSSWSSACDC